MKALLSSLVLLTVVLLNPSRDSEPLQKTREVNAAFAGQKGTFAQFGDSITVTQAFWTPLKYSRRNPPPGFEEAFKRVDAYLRLECWRDWKGPEFGSEGGKTVAWALENIDAWLKKLNPEVALIMFGSNDLTSVGVDEYQTQLRELAYRCLRNGTVVILTTIPPRHGFEAKAAQFADAARKVSQQLKVPLIDFHAEILKRRPDDWDGALEKFSAFQDYEVPTLLARDGVHPSFPKQFQDDYSDEGLRSSGYTLRNYLTLLAYSDVIRALQENGPLVRRNPVEAWHPKAPRLASPAGEVIRVKSVTELEDALSRVRPGGTVMLADGSYPLSRPLEVRTDRVALRGESGIRENVVLDGGGPLGEGIRVTACSGVTIADLTLQNVRWNGIKINSDSGVQKLRIYNCVLHNIWQRAVKGVKVSREGRERLRPRDCVVEYCLFYNDHPKQFSDDASDTPQTFNGDYIGGIDVMYASGWVIRDNVFIGIQGRTRQARGAVFLWHETEDCIVERNVIVDCDSGICLGNSSKDVETPVHASRCIVRNNMITRAPENGIIADYTKDCKVLHNTVYDPASRLQRGIRIVHENDGLVVANNLFVGPRILKESESHFELTGNVERNGDIPMFVNPDSGNLRLGVIPGGWGPVARLSEAMEDIDRRKRGGRTYSGAHELGRN